MSSQTLPSGTLIVAGGLSYTTDNSVTVPGGTGSFFGCSSPGTSPSVSVTAADIGSDYNTASGTAFSVSNHANASSVYLRATATTNISGGESHQGTEVTAEDIQKAFQPFYESTVLEKETNPNMLYDIKHLLEQKQVYTQEEVESFAKVFFSKRTVKDDLGKVSGFLKPAMNRYLELEELNQKEFKSSLSSFVRLYAFITQVVRMYDKELHEFYTYAKFLLKVLPSRSEEDIDLEGKISMDYYKLQKSYQGQIELVKESEGTVYGAEHA
jgi:hypothetical protein